MLEPSQAIIPTLVGGLAVLSAVVGWLRWIRPRFHHASSQVVAVRDSILGRDPIVDSITGRIIEPALPGVGVRLEKLEDASLTALEAIGKLADSHIRLNDHSIRIKDIEDRTSSLERGTVERIVTRSESAAAWRAVEAVANSHPDGVAPDRVDPPD